MQVVSKSKKSSVFAQLTHSASLTCISYLAEETSFEDQTRAHGSISGESMQHTSLIYYDKKVVWCTSNTLKVVHLLRINHEHMGAFQESVQHSSLIYYDKNDDVCPFLYVINRDFGWDSLYHFLLKPSFI